MSALCCCGSRRKENNGPATDNDHQLQSREAICQLKRIQPTPVIPNPEVPSKIEKNISKGAQPKEAPYTTPVQVDELVVNDDDSDTGGPLRRPDLTRRASAALGAVRTRIIRHLSSQSDVKRQSAAYVGKSQEEVARRAELRRLRQKRIQNELENDINRELKKDSNTKGPLEQPGNVSVKSIRHGSLTSPSQAQPGGGPRDTIEFAVPDGNQGPSKDDSPAHSLTSRGPHRRDHRLSRQPSGVLSNFDQADGNAQEDQTDRQPKSRDNRFSGAAKTSLNIPHSETRSTFRLSSSSSWLDRIVGVDNTFTDTGENPSLDGRSALSIWLAAQGLRSRDSPTANLGPDDVQKAAGGPCETKGSKGFDEVSISVSELSYRDGPLDSESQTLTKTSLVRRTSCASAKGPRPGHIPEPTSTTDEDPLHKSPSEDLALDYAAAMAFASPDDNGSSQYASGVQSLQPSPSRSRANLHRLNTHELQQMQLSPFQWHRNMVIQRKVDRSEAQSSYVTAQDHVSTCDLPALSSAPNDPVIDHEITDATSPAHSETASFQIREAELRTIEKRFADVLSRQKPTTYASRFVEDFSEPPQPTKKKSSLIPRMIHLHAPGKFKHTSKNKPLTQTQDPSSQTLPVPATANSTGHAHHQGSPPEKSPSSAASWSEASPKLGLKESATDLWQRALRQEAEQRRGTSTRSPLSSRPSPSHSKKSLHQGSIADPQVSTEIWPSGSKQFLEVPGTTRTPSQSKWRLPQWATPANNKNEGSREGWPKLPIDLAEAPESWARYPAHDRGERNAHAGSGDDVKSQDFAVGAVLPDGEMGWITDSDPRADEYSENRRSASMHGKLGKAVKTGITRLLPFTENMAQSRSNSLGWRRGSFQLAGEVEYPELEVLPPGIGHILEPEQVADTMSSRRRSHTTSSCNSFGRYSVTKALEHRTSAGSLTQRQQHISRPSPDADPLVCRSLDILPKTPLKVLERGDKNSTPRTDVFVTPLSGDLGLEDAEDRRSRHGPLPIAKSEHILPFYRVHPDVDGAVCTRSFTWSGSLSSAQRPQAAPSHNLTEYQVYSRPRNLNASKDSFATRASFATAAAD